jgi:hypothetical protein
LRQPFGGVDQVAIRRVDLSLKDVRRARQHRPLIACGDAGFAELFLEAGVKHIGAWRIGNQFPHPRGRLCQRKVGRHDAPAGAFGHAGLQLAKLGRQGAQPVEVMVGVGGVVDRVDIAQEVDDIELLAIKLVDRVVVEAKTLARYLVFQRPAHGIVGKLV